MIEHLILMTLHDTADAPFVANEVLSLGGRIPGLVAVHGGPSVITTGNTWQLGFVMTFDTADSVRTYQSHPAHARVADAIRGLLSGMATCDLAVGATEGADPDPQAAADITHALDR